MGHHVYQYPPSSTSGVVADVNVVSLPSAATSTDGLVKTIPGIRTVTGTIDKTGSETRIALHDGESVAVIEFVTTGLNGSPTIYAEAFPTSTVPIPSGDTGAQLPWYDYLLGSSVDAAGGTFASSVLNTGLGNMTYQLSGLLGFKLLGLSLLNGSPTNDISFKMNIYSAAAVNRLDALLRDSRGNPVVVGQTGMANSLPVAIASDQSAIPTTVGAGSAIIGKVGIDQSTGGTTNGVALVGINSAAVDVGTGNVGGGTQRVVIATNQSAISTNAALQAGSAIVGKVGVDQTTPGTTNAVALAQIGSTTVASGNGVVGSGVQRVAVASDNTPFPVKVDQTTPGTTNAMSLAQVGSTTVATGNGVVGAGVQRVAIASDNSNVPTNVAQMNGVTVLMGAGATGTGSQRSTEANCSSASLSNVASSASNVTLLASNSSRRAATFYNDSTQICYLKFGATASSTSYTVQMAAGAYYEIPQPCYSGIVDGIWASANGNMRVTEVT